MGKFFLLVWLLSPTAFAAKCAFPTAPTVLLSSGDPGKHGGRLMQTWEVPAAKIFWSKEKPVTPSLKKFTATIEKAVEDLSPVTLLKRALALTPAHWGDAKNLKLAVERADAIREVRCLESLLLSFQTDRMDMVAEPTEFMAFVLKSRTTEKLRIFYYTANEPGIKGLKEISEAVEKELAAKSDWRLWVNLHNHNFMLTKPNILGVTAPSTADVGAFRNFAKDMGLEEAWITNGFHTIVIPQADFAIWSAP